MTAATTLSVSSRLITETRSVVALLEAVCGGQESWRSLAGEYGFGSEGHAPFEGLVDGAAPGYVGQAGALVVVEVAFDEDLAAYAVEVTGCVGLAVVAVASVDPVVLVAGRHRVEFPTLASAVQRHGDGGAGSHR